MNKNQIYCPTSGHKIPYDKESLKQYCHILRAFSLIRDAARMFRLSYTTPGERCLQ